MTSKYQQRNLFQSNKYLYYKNQNIFKKYENHENCNVLNTTLQRFPLKYLKFLWEKNKFKKIKYAIHPCIINIYYTAKTNLRVLAININNGNKQNKHKNRY